MSDRFREVALDGLTAVAGGPLDLGAPSIAATNGAIHPELIAALKEVASRR